MALASQITGNTEIIQVAEAVAREKGIEREHVIEAIEQAIQVAARKKYGYEQNIKAVIDRKSGETKLTREREVVEEFTVEEQAEESGEDSGSESMAATKETQVLLDIAQRVQPGIKVGEILVEELPPMDIGRVAAQTAKQVITQRVKDAEREKQYEQFKDKKDTIINGSVKSVEYGNVILDVNGTEAVLRRESVLPREIYRPGDRIRAYVVDVSREARGPQVFLSRTHPTFMEKLFAQEVPEIYDGIIEIKAIARDPGSRAKIAVASRDSNIDAKASCIGIRGSRVQAVVNELQGEKIDIIDWSPDPAVFVVNALTPVQVTKVVVEEDERRIEVVVPEDQQSLAIGRRGQNVKLASELSGWYIEILTEDAESSRRQEEFSSLSKLFIEALDVEEIIAHLLVTEGFTSIEEVAYVDVDELAGIEGFDADVAAELQSRAKESLQNQVDDQKAKAKEMGVDDNMFELPGKEGETLDPAIVLKLAEKNVRTRDDLGDLATDEFYELVPKSGLNVEEVNELIMAARAHWFENDE
ncbi:MAG: transcription termination/antitermination protein NusA [Alphaproteobacteria bacterium CG11_big_fil_rev_8_21_14_0_20_44_7]|nr:MAG: transcription termination/antitermination protein NusA [Alphaproteobacteria bacterium CG11_big_fil_rev_8_21_14_0_20_44_7]